MVLAALEVREVLQEHKRSRLNPVWLGSRRPIECKRSHTILLSRSSPDSSLVTGKLC